MKPVVPEFILFYVTLIKSNKILDILRLKIDDVDTVEH